MKKNYYYNGIKVRSSDNDYSHAIIYNYVNKDGEEKFRLIACSGSYQAVINRFKREYNYLSNEDIWSSTYGQHSKEKASKLQIVELKQQ